MVSKRHQHHSSPPGTLAVTNFPHLRWGSLDLEGVTIDVHSGLNTPQSLVLCIWSSCESLYHPHKPLQKEMCPMRAVSCTDLPKEFLKILMCNLYKDKYLYKSITSRVWERYRNFKVKEDSYKVRKRSVLSSSCCNVA